jgi:hypothetical protein
MTHVMVGSMGDKHYKQILILGIGCILYSDEGFGVRVIELVLEEARHLGVSYQRRSQ